MQAHLKYLRYVLRHKLFVLLAGLGLGVPIWRLIFHDWTKFLPREWFPYVSYFYGKKVAQPNTQVWDESKQCHVPKMVVPSDVQQAFDYAWNHHQKRNDHHWQFWLLHPDNPRPTFSFQSYDGGMTHITVSRVSDGKAAALVFDENWKADPEAERQLVRELNYLAVALPMTDVARREMLADWMGAGRALGKPDTSAWYEANKDKMQLHPETRAWVEAELKHQANIDRTSEAFKAGLYG